MSQYTQEATDLCQALIYKFLFAFHLYLRLYMLALWLLVDVRTSRYGYSGDSRYNSIQNLEKHPHFPTLYSSVFIFISAT